MSKKEIEILQKKLQEEVAKKEELALQLKEKNKQLISLNANLTKLVSQKTISLDTLFENILDPYILMDLFGNVLKMNTEAKKFFGYNSDKEHFNVNNIVFEKDLHYVTESFKTLYEKGSFENFQARVYTKEKKVKWVQINAKTVLDVKGKPTFAHGIIRDISEKIEQDLKFENQKKLLDVIIDNAPLGIILANKNQRILKTNTSFQKMLGYSKEEFAKLKITDVSRRKDFDKLQNKINQVLERKIDGFSTKKKYITKNNTSINSKINVSIVKNKNESLKYIIGFIEDISEEQKKEKLLLFLNNLMSSILGKTGKREISSEVSKKITKLLNFEICEIIFYDEENKVLNHYSDESPDRKVKLSEMKGKSIIQTVINSKKPLVINDVSLEEAYYPIHKTTKSEITVPIIYDKKVIGLINAESSKKDFFTKYHLNTLATIANLIATKLNNVQNLEQIIKAEKEKEKLLKSLKLTNKELKDFAHIVSHDLKSPLRSMNAILNWLQEDCQPFLTATITKNFELLFKKINKMDLLVGGLLDYTSVDKIARKIKHINLNTILEEVIDNTTSGFSNIKVIKKISLPTIIGDTFRLTQLFQNLIENAIKYIDKEEKIIIVNCEEKDEFWEFSIADNGIGIDEKYHKKIFEVFQMLEESEQSTGIGLSIVTKIIDFYGGKIWLESQLKVGTTFYFTLPKNN